MGGARRHEARIREQNAVLGVPAVKSAFVCSWRYRGYLQVNALSTELSAFVRKYVDVRIDAVLTISGRQRYAVRIGPDGDWYHGRTLLQAIRAAKRALNGRAES